MESNTSNYYKKDNEEESLLANVASLRHELKITEWSLQSLGEELSSVSPSENSDYACNPSRSERLILEELSQPSQLGLLNYSPYKKICKMPSSSTDFQKQPRDKISFSSANAMDQEMKSLREKLNKLRQQNACLVSQNHSLMTKIESVHFELTQSRAKVSMLESAQQQAANVPILEEQIINLEAEVSAQDKVLREAEDKLEQSQKMVIEKEQSLQKSQEECIKLKVDLLEQSKQGKRCQAPQEVMAAAAASSQDLCQPQEVHQAMPAGSRDFRWLGRHGHPCLATPADSWDLAGGEQEVWRTWQSRRPLDIEQSERERAAWRAQLPLSPQLPHHSCGN
uniref:Coiled-coil domain containing 18 n=1 Tax=Myotis myotis TaxID=51298 RepID=A0A7J7ZT26_MYOMY|nr:coiled-coil domain containing 18 [Myotis myotis]